MSFVNIVVCGDQNVSIPICVLINSILHNAKNPKIIRIYIIANLEKLYKNTDVFPLRHLSYYNKKND